jgi:hypothetical protein
MLCPSGSALSIGKTLCMTEPADDGRARRPDGLGRLLVERARRGDVEGVVASMSQRRSWPLGAATSSWDMTPYGVTTKWLLAEAPQFVGDLQLSLQLGTSRSPRLVLLAGRPPRLLTGRPMTPGLGRWTNRALSSGRALFDIAWVALCSIDCAHRTGVRAMER